MTMPEHSPTLFMFCTFALLVVGFVVLNFGKRTPGRGSWLVWSGVLILLLGIGIDSGLLVKESFGVKVWMAGWVWPKNEIGAVTVGILQDALGLFMAGLAGLVSCGLLLCHSYLSKEPHPERSYAAIAISTAGVALAWTSLTPWLVFMGIVFTILGGFISLGSRWDLNMEATLAARFLWERSSGFILAFFGACLLAVSRPALLLNHTELWSTQADSLTSTWIGSILLVAGLFIQMQPFPLLGWVVSGTEASPPLKTLLNQIFPAWAAFSLLVRLEPQWVSLGLFPDFGWIALISAVLIILSGLFQKRWHIGLSTWLSASFSLSCAFLAFTGPLPAVSMLIGSSMGALALSLGAFSFGPDCAQTAANKKRAFWVKLACVLAAGAGTGLIGFVSATGSIRWIAHAMTSPATVALFLLVFFLFGLLGWKQVWSVMRTKAVTDSPWLSIFSLYLWIFLALGFLWTGSVTGGLLPNSSDHLIPSFFDLVFGAKSSEIEVSVDFISASGLYWGLLILAIAAGYWTAGRKEDRWATLSHALPRLSQFLSQGYQVDIVLKRGAQGLIGLGRISEKFIDQKIWAEWIPHFAYLGISTVSNGVSRADTQVTYGLNKLLRKAVEIPAKILQLIQTGDLRWYLFFSLTSGFVLLLYFLKT